MVDVVYNEKDNQLLAFCMNKQRSVNEIAKHLEINPASVVFKIKKLSDKLDVKKQGKGKKTYIRTKEGDKVKKYMIEALNILNENGEMTTLEFSQIYPFWKIIDDPEGLDKKRALAYVEFHSPKFVEHYIKITPEGEKFLKDNQK